ncbi:MAG: hypothetical protein RIS36_2150 [Pseudomonadota bacterium]|jgi:hypothetical protein
MSWARRINGKPSQPDDNDAPDIESLDCDVAGGIIGRQRKTLRWPSVPLYRDEMSPDFRTDGICCNRPHLW